MITTVWKVIILFFGLFVAFTIGEVLARLILPPPPCVLVASQPGTSMQASTGFRNERIMLPYHPEQGHVYISTPTGRRLRPNAHVVIKNHLLSRRQIEIKTNRQGYRNREIGPKKGCRILFLGDSITFGDYLSEEETFVRLIEEHARRDSMDWETINAGVGAVSLQNELAILLESGLSVEPDVIVVCYYLNDFLESPGVQIPKVSALLAKSRLASHIWLYILGLHLRTSDSLLNQRASSVEILEIEGWRKAFAKELIAGEKVQSEEQGRFHEAVLSAFPDWGGAWSPHTWPKIKACLQQMRDVAQRNNSQLIVVAFPVRLQAETSFLDNYPQQRLQEIAVELGVPFLDLLPLFRTAHPSQKTSLFYDQCHHTPEGNRLIASEIYGFLRRYIEDHGESKP